MLSAKSCWKNGAKICLNILFNRPTKKDVHWLALNVYYESRGEPIKGQIAVAYVTVNRTMTKGFPNSIERVVKQRRRNVCQFSWWCDPNLRKPKNLAVWEKSKEVARKVLYQLVPNPVQNSTFYHASYVNPKWDNLTVTTTIGEHTFYVGANAI